MTSHAVRLLGVITAGTLLVPSPAAAADEVGLSHDGVSWSSGLQRPLFDPDLRWVPGDSQTATFFVRNQGPSGASMTIEVRGTDETTLLENDDIALRVRVDGGSWKPLANGGASGPLTERGVDQDGVVQVEVNASFDPASTNQSQRRDLGLSFEMNLTELGPANPSGSWLPRTGSPVSWGLVVTGAALVGAGAVAVVGRRRTGGPTHG